MTSPGLEAQIANASAQLAEARQRMGSQGAIPPELAAAEAALGGINANTSSAQATLATIVAAIERAVSSIERQSSQQLHAVAAATQRQLALDERREAADALWQAMREEYGDTMDPYLMQRVEEHRTAADQARRQGDTISEYDNKLREFQLQHELAIAAGDAKAANSMEKIIVDHKRDYQAELEAAGHSLDEAQAIIANTEHEVTQDIQRSSKAPTPSAQEHVPSRFDQWVSAEDVPAKDSIALTDVDSTEVSAPTVGKAQTGAIAKL